MQLVAGQEKLLLCFGSASWHHFSCSLDTQTDALEDVNVARSLLEEQLSREIQTPLQHLLPCPSRRPYGNSFHYLVQFCFASFAMGDYNLTKYSSDTRIKLMAQVFLIHLSVHIFLREAVAITSKKKSNF